MKQLELQNEQLINTNNDLDNFIYTASHDLKAPVSNLEGLLKAFSEEHVFDESQQNYLKMMFESIERCKKTIEDLTEINKVQRLKRDDVETLHFKEIIDTVQSEMHELFRVYNPILEINLHVETISYSRKNLKSIVYNLLSNALKYSSLERRPHIIISTIEGDDCTILSIRDNGLGLSNENKSRIFEMFKRAHQHVEGAGIGLYMIKRIVENLGGKIEIESTLGKGTIFHVYLKCE